MRCRFTRITMPYRFLGAIALAFLLPLPAAAIVVDGTFTGIAHATPTFETHQAHGRTGQGYDGATVTGTFRVNIPTAPWDDGSGTSPPSGEISFTLMGDTFSFLAGPQWADSPGAVSVAMGPRQSVSFLTTYQPRFDGAILTFGSDDGRLFDGDDFSTLAIDGRTVSWMDASFAASSAAVSVVVDVDRFSFGQVAAPVPEPSSLALLGGGLALTAWGARRRRGGAAG